MSIADQQHWDKVYNTKTGDKVSWFQSYPKTSMEFVKLFNLPLTANIIDIGGGDSHFVDALIDKGYQNIWVLDISESAIEKAKQRLGLRALKVNWVVSDVTDFKPPVKFDFWHDRAAFHFLTTENNINKYVSIAENATKKDGYLILGTFSETSMSARFELAFERIKCIEEDHTTPFNTIQNFVFCSFKKK